MNKKLEGALQILVLAAAAALSVVWPARDLSAPAQENPSAASAAERQGSTALGRNAYRIYCASCHGATAKGNGPVGSYLKIPPADLTRLAAQNQGAFPADKVYAVIDGRDEGVPSHGTRDMPVWGLSFQTQGDDADQEAEVRARILDLVAYLKSIQAGVAQ
jgi:mono/diheme cytochrome c family protein